MSKIVSNAVERKARALIDLFNEKFKCAGKAVELEHPDQMPAVAEADHHQYHSSRVMKILHRRLKALHRYLTEALPHVDHPRAAHDLEVMKDRHLAGALQHLEKSHMRHHDTDIDDATHHAEVGYR